MITWSGVHVTPEDGNAPRIRDLAVAMCRITRYAGALWCPLAAHSLLVADLLFLHDGGAQAWAHGLLHDAHECVTGELTKWWKPKEMKPLERELDRRILGYFHLDYEAFQADAARIKEADEKALCAEATILGLPGWEDFRRSKHASVPDLTPQEYSIAEIILRGKWVDAMMVYDGSTQANELSLALGFIHGGLPGNAVQQISVVEQMRVK